MSNENKFTDEDLLLEISRSKRDLPSTGALQASIIARAESTPQLTAGGVVGVKSSGVLARYLRFTPKFNKWLVPTATVLASLTLIVIFQPIPMSSPVGPVTAPNNVNDTELEWQEFMLSEDEFLFGEVAAN